MPPSYLIRQKVGRYICKWAIFDENKQPILLLISKYGTDAYYSEIMNEPLFVVVNVHTLVCW